MTTAETVINCIAKITGIAAADITAETTLESLGIDSLDQIEIAMDIETALNIALPDDWIAGETVGDVIKMVEALLKDVTPGPWSVRPDLVITAHDPEGPDYPWSVARVTEMCGWPVQTEDNARFIAAARDLVPALAAERDAALRERDEARAEGAKLAAWQCSFTDGKTGLVCDEYGNQFCAMQRRAEKATTELAALRKEVDRLRAALEPLAAMADRYDPDEGDDGNLECWSGLAVPKIHHLREARAALTAEPLGHGVTADDFGGEA